MWITRVIVLFVVCGSFVRSEPKEVLKIGGIFEEESGDQETVFRFAAADINADRTLLPRHKVRVQMTKVPPEDDLAAAEGVCGLMKAGVVGVFGPITQYASQTVQSICDQMELPNVVSRWEFGQKRHSYMLNIHPKSETLSKAIFDLIVAWKWKSFTILYESGDWLPRMAHLLKMHHLAGHTVTSKELDLGIQDNFRPILTGVKKSGEKNIVLDCSVEKLPEVLKQAQQVGLMSDQHQFIITSLDMHILDLEPFQHGGTNITGIRIIDPDDPFLKATKDMWVAHEKRKGNELAEELYPERISSASIFLYDAVRLYAAALHELDSSNQVSAKVMDCDESDSWVHGYSIINYMRTTTVNGLSRTIKFDNEGFRTDFVLDIIELTSSGIIKVGEWNSTEGLNITRTYETIQRVEGVSVQNMSFIVLTAISPPYGMLKKSSERLFGNDRYEGFGVELIDVLSKMLGFQYTFQIQEDGVYGSLNRETMQWNGMIKELLEYRADLAITDLTITSDRESAVDFTMPFMNLGISILFTSSTKSPPSLFSFASPFSTEVWYYLGGSYVGVSLLLFILGRISPAEWQNPYPCIEEPELLFNQFSLKNSFWFTIGAIMQQGTEIAPIAASTRMIASIWWFFTLIMVSSYTANLAAFLTIEPASVAFSSAEELADHKTIKYGAKRDGSTISFFKDAVYEPYQKMYRVMMENPDQLTASNPEGQARVKEGGYAFLMESTSIEYITERQCDLTQVGGLLDDKGYGIAMRKKSPYRHTLSAAVLKLQEQGILSQMKRKWWNEKDGGGACSADAVSSGGADRLGIPNVGGVFVVLVVGSGMAIFLVLGELIFNVVMKARRLKSPIKTELVEEFKFVLSGADTKPMRYRSASRKSSADTQDLTGMSVGSEETAHERTEPLPYGFANLMSWNKKSQLDVYKVEDNNSRSQASNKEKK